MDIEHRRNEEAERYGVIYTEDKNYRMGDERKRVSNESLMLQSFLGYSLLDVGCGRGEMLKFAIDQGYTPVAGVEAIPELVGNFGTHAVYLGMAHDLPFPTKSWDVVTCFDVLEHLIPEDVEKAVQELERLARRTIIISAADYPHSYRGKDLHPSRRSYGAWRELLIQNLPGFNLTLERDCSMSKLWIFSA